MMNFHAAVLHPYHAHVWRDNITTGLCFAPNDHNTSFHVERCWYFKTYFPLRILSELPRDRLGGSMYAVLCQML